MIERSQILDNPGRICMCSENLTADGQRDSIMSQNFRLFVWCVFGWSSDRSSSSLLLF